MLTNGHLVWLILFAPLLAAGAIMLGTRRRLPAGVCMFAERSTPTVFQALETLASDAHEGRVFS